MVKCQNLISMQAIRREVENITATRVLYLKIFAATVSIIAGIVLITDVVNKRKKRRSTAVIITSSVFLIGGVILFLSSNNLLNTPEKRQKLVDSKVNEWNKILKRKFPNKELKVEDNTVCKLISEEYPAWLNQNERCIDLVNINKSNTNKGINNINDYRNQYQNKINSYNLQKNNSDTDKCELASSVLEIEELVNDINSDNSILQLRNAYPTFKRKKKKICGELNLLFPKTKDKVKSFNSTIKNAYKWSNKSLYVPRNKDIDSVFDFIGECSNYKNKKD